MIKAYHHVSTSFLPQILESGVISPVAFRLDPEYMRWDCVGKFDQVREMVADEKGNPHAVPGLELLLAQRLKEILDVSSMETKDTGLFCEDILAGDAFSVFLSTGEWGRLDEEVVPNGFVFDAEDLIRRGGALRESDLMEAYSYVMEQLPWSAARSARGAQRELEHALNEVKAGEELRGRKALTKLRKEPEDYNEILFPGAVSLDWAVELWEAGVLVPRATA